MDLPTVGTRYTGLPVTDRMKRWGITAMIGYGEGWDISDTHGCIRVPNAVGEWLAERA